MIAQVAAVLVPGLGVRPRPAGDRALAPLSQRGPGGLSSWTDRSPPRVGFGITALILLDATYLWGAIVSTLALFVALDEGLKVQEAERRAS